ncbi:MAG: Smr/MutS family protein [Bacteroidales bacterium]|nr:Smr/MutS family protein [Bacteroidales bacterium]
MTYPDTFVQKTGFDSIVALLQEECLTVSAARMAGRLVPLSDFEKLNAALRETDEFRRVLLLEKAFPAQDYFDLRDEIKRLRVKGTYITLEGLQQFRASYTAICAIKEYLEKIDAGNYPRLAALGAEQETDPRLLAHIDALLTPTGELKDNASEELLRIRTQIRRKASQTQRYIGQYMQTAVQQGWVEENADITVRNERLVIPVMAAYKKSMRGFIHDVSSTGQTVFMEPEEIFNLNNEIVELRNQERIEIIEILKRFSDRLRLQSDSLLQSYRFLVFIDLLRAKARLAVRLEAVLPVVEPAPCFQWKRARHPLLFLTIQKQGETGRSQIVPLDLSLEPSERILIVSGPNAGGKSVCLKTVGLLQYMMQCGLLVPMDEDSRMGMVNNIFVDIGDEQSIENDLSTYSSHLKNMKFWVENADSRTLFLCDELGGGTEPSVGGAIAEALVEHLLAKGAYGIVTTHYTNLKLMAPAHAGIVNGAMLFDSDNLKPLYVLRKGLPGSSFAFEIARKTGLPESLLEQAARKVGNRQMNFEQVQQQLEVEKHEIARKKQEIDLADELLSSTLQKYNGLLADLEKNRNKLLSEAREEARRIVKQANADIERTIREIKEAQAEKNATARLRKTLQTTVEQGVSAASAKPAPEAFSFKKQPTALSQAGSSEKSSAFRRPAVFKEGDRVRLKDGSSSVARIGKIKGNQARIDFEYMSMQVPLSRLEALTPAESLRYDENSRRSQVSVENINSGKENFSAHIDIRGMRADQAWQSVSKLIDEAVLYGEKRLEILHGKGNGILRQIVRTLASENPHVASFSDQSEELGGTGITLVELR